MQIILSIRGIKLANRGLLSSKQGFVFASINQTLYLSSIMKSNPKISYYPMPNKIKYR